VLTMLSGEHVTNCLMLVISRNPGKSLFYAKATAAIQSHARVGARRADLLEDEPDPLSNQGSVHCRSRPMWHAQVSNQ